MATRVRASRATHHKGGDMISDCTAVPCIPTKDVASARRFYEDVLGLHVKDENMGGITYELGSGTTLFLYESEFAGVAKHTLCNLESDHVDDDIADLRDKGVRFETYDGLDGVSFDQDGVATMTGEDVEGEMHGVWFKDPDGNILALFETADVTANV